MPHIDFTKHPTADFIQKTIANAKKDNADLVYQKILSIVETNKINSTNWVNLFVKVEIINAVFNTGILSSRKYADYIFKNVKNIDIRLVKGDKSLVKEIATFRIEKKEDNSIVVRNNYSFATKFCHLHQPELFPIYDSKVRKSLLSYQKHFKGQLCPTNFTATNLKDYNYFCDVINRFKKISGDGLLSNRDIDRFLWLMAE